MAQNRRNGLREKASAATGIVLAAAVIHSFGGGSSHGLTATLDSAGASPLHETHAAKAAVRYAKAQLGKPYAWGGTGPDAFDCSGLVFAAYRFPSSLRTSQEQWAGLPHIPASKRGAGDIEFIVGSDGTPQAPGHEVLLISRNKAIEAYGVGYLIRVISLRNPPPGDQNVVGFADPAGADMGAKLKIAAGVAVLVMASGVHHHGHHWSYGVPVLDSASAPNASAALGERLAARDYGWTGHQWDCLNSLWSGESSWSNTADTRKTGLDPPGASVFAYGIPQARGHGATTASGVTAPYPAPYQAANPRSLGGSSDARTEIKWGLGYISSTYGTPCAALSFKQSTGNKGY